MESFNHDLKHMHNILISIDFAFDLDWFTVEVFYISSYTSVVHKCGFILCNLVKNIIQFATFSMHLGILLHDANFFTIRYFRKQKVQSSIFSKIEKHCLYLFSLNTFNFETNSTSPFYYAFSVSNYSRSFILHGWIICYLQKHTNHPP